jgi:hypothetical protein
MSNRCICLVSGFVVLAIVAAGCGQSGPTTIPIHGEVLHNGNPLQEGLVVYLPKNSDNTRQASGRIQRDGTFELTTFKSGDGVVPGEYSIIVYPSGSPGSGGLTREQMEAAAQSGNRQQHRSIIPDKYSDPEASGLSDTVNADHSGVKRIELTD